MVNKISEIFANDIKAVVPVIIFQQKTLIIEGEESYGTVKVVDNNFFKARNIHTEIGTLFTNEQIKNSEPVVVIGASLTEQFKGKNPI